MPNYLKEVRNQYETLPYPHRDPEDEKKRLRTSLTVSLEYLNYYCYEGKETFTNNFRALIAGGGTGDATIFLAEQLRHTDAEIVHIDMSISSIEVAKRRAEIRELTNITWIHESLLNLADLDIGVFDHVNCVGVLHHLEDPAAGLRALTSVLKEDGALGLMVYGKYGRTGVYQLQEALRLLNGNESDTNIKLRRCKSLLTQLPKGNWFERSRDEFDDIDNDNAEIYDLCLHSTDRPYTVPEIYDLLASCNLVLCEFIAAEGAGKLMYSPRSFIQGPELRRTLDSLDRRTQQSIAELLIGSIKKHLFYAAKNPKKVPSTGDLDNIPYFSMHFYTPDVHQELSDLVRNSQDGAVSLSNRNLHVQFEKTELIEAMTLYIDGVRSLREIFDEVTKDYRKERKTPPGLDIMKHDFDTMYNALNFYDWMLLRHNSVKPFQPIKEIAQRVADKYALT